MGHWRCQLSVNRLGADAVHPSKLDVDATRVQYKGRRGEGGVQTGVRAAEGEVGCLQKWTGMKLQDLPDVLSAYCVLHNICEMREVTVEPEMMFEVVDDEMVAEDAIISVSAMYARDCVAHNLLHSG